MDFPGKEGAAFETLLAQCADAMALVDAQGDVRAANAAWAELWGEPAVTMLGRPLALLHPSLDIAKAADRPEAHSTIHARIGGPDGAPRWLAVSLSRVGSDERPVYLALALDSTAEVLRGRQMKMMATIIDTAPTVNIVMDAQGRILVVNQAFRALFGYSRAEALGKSGMDLLGGPCTDKRQCGRVRSRLEKYDSARGELLLYDRSGEEIWVSTLTRVVRNSHGRIVNYILMLEDIGEAKKIHSMQQAVLDAIAKDRPLAEIGELLCRRITSLAPDVTPSLLLVDADDKVHPVAGPGLPKGFAEIVDGAAIGPTVGSCGAAAYLQRPVLARDIATDPNWAAFNQLPLEAGLRACWSSPIIAKDGRSIGAFALYFREKRGPSRWHEQMVAAALDLCALAIDRHQAQEKIERLAYYDALTSLPNRARLQESFEALIVAPEVEKAAVLFIDLDNFKDVNDTLGHSVGDELLAWVAGALKAHVQPGDLLARHAGDEFVAVLPGRGAAEAEALAERIRLAMSEPLRLQDTIVPVTLSIGVALYPQDGRDAETLLINADSAMYAAKRAGRGTHRLFDPAIRRASEERVVVSRALREALAADALELHFQPQVWTGTGVLRGVEALARWTDPALGIIPPGRFIPIAEEYGLIAAIGDWSLRAALRQLAAWRKAGAAIPQVSVNLSPAQLHDPMLAGKVARMLDEYGLAPSDLTLEITEGALMKDRTAGLEAACAIHALGVCISLDDFGTGYSNLARLGQLPISELKIDRSFMHTIADDPNARAVANIAVQIGKSLRMQVVAEGVETVEQKRVLQELGCEAAQGYFFARPMPAAQLVDWLLAQQAAAPAIAAA